MTLLHDSDSGTPLNRSPFGPVKVSLLEGVATFQGFKQSMKATTKTGLSLNQLVFNFLLTYRSTPHATTGVAHCTLFVKGQLRTRLDLLRHDRGR